MVNDESVLLVNILVWRAICAKEYIFLKKTIINCWSVHKWNISEIYPFLYAEVGRPSIKEVVVHENHNLGLEFEGREGANKLKWVEFTFKI